MKLLFSCLISYFWLIQCSGFNKGYFWQVTDFHYDANYSINGNPNSMCHLGGSSNYSNSIYGNYLCDAPMALIKSAINAMKKIHPDPDFILWTGDSVPHVKDGELNQTKVFYNIGNVTNQLLQIFPNTSIFPVLGNHDEHPKDNFPAVNTTYYSDILSVCHWSEILGQVEAELFKIGGYYKSVTKTNLVVLGLNTNIYYAFDPLTNGSTDPAGQFSWLEKQLQSAKTNNQKVIIIAHVPPGLFELSSGLMWFYDSFNEKYISLVAQYYDVITVQIYGHEHTDSFRILKDNGGKPIGMLFLSPAVTPWKSTLPGVGSNNPSIRLYEYNQQTYEILNYHQYYLNLSSVLTTKVANWEKEYDAKKDYNLTSLNADSFTLAAKTFRSDPVLFKKYLQFNSVSQNLNPKCNETCQKVHFCSITELRTKNFKVCLNNHQTTTTVDPTPQHSTTTVDPTRQHSTTTVDPTPQHSTTTVDPTPQHSTTTVNPTPQHSTTPEPKEPVSQTMIIFICTFASVVFVCAVVVAILCIKRHIIFIPHRYSRFSSPLSKGPIN